MPAAIIGYIRVSTDKQGKSGLGLEAQREAIARFAAAESLEVAGEFIEVETGKGADALDKRPQLAAALRRCLECDVSHARDEAAAHCGQMSLAPSFKVAANMM